METLASSRQLPVYSELIGRPIDNTAQTDYMRCPNLYLKGMVENRRPAGMPTPALNYGSGWHVIMALNYKAPVMERRELIDMVETKSAEKWGLSSNPDDYRTFQRAQVEYEKYLNKWGLPWEEEGETVGWPTNPMVEIAVEMPIPGARHPYVGKLDRFLKRSGQSLIEDHKTASREEKDYFEQWSMSNQMQGYAVLGSLVTGDTINSIRINLHIIRKSDSVFERRTLHFAQHRLDRWKRNYDHWLERIERDMELWKAGDPRAFPQNFSACAGKYSMCVYKGVCSDRPDLEEMGLAQDFEVNPWNPLEADDD